MSAVQERLLDRAAAMGRDAGEFLAEFGIPARNPFHYRPGHPLEEELARAWARGYTAGLSGRAE